MYQDQKFIGILLMSSALGKSMFILWLPKILSIHGIKIRRTEFQYFLVKKEKYIQILSRRALK